MKQKIYSIYQDNIIGEERSEIRLAILIPSYDGKAYLDFTLSLIKLIQMLDKKRVTFNVITIEGCSLITICRNELISRALSEGYDFFLFLDTDVGFDADQLLTMFDLAQTKSIKCVSGAYPFKKIIGHKQAENGKWLDVVRPVFHALTSEAGGLSLSPDADGFLEAEGVGAGLLLIQADIVRQIASASASYVNADGKTVWEIFQTGIFNGSYFSEDTFFCKRVRELGERVYLYLNINSRHHGGYVYRWGG